MTATRRLAAILAADVVGYSRLMGEDEAGTAKIVRERREAAAPIVAAHGGRVFKTMGDGILIEFASVVAAVECALAMQKQAAERNAEAPEAKSVVYRIGVHLGDVLVDGEDVLGDGVNIATRLEGVAEPGGVCVSGSAFDHVRGRVEAEFIDLGERALKNIARPVRVYALEVGEIARASASTPPRPAVPAKPTARALWGIAASDFYLCGPAAFMTSLTVELADWGVPGGRVHSENFGSGPALTPGVAAAPSQRPHAPDRPPGAGPMVSFARSNLALPWDSGFQSLLELAEACDVPVRWACRTGVCHNCESGLIAGSVDYLPDPIEPPGDGNLLICCSRPVSDIVLDL